MSDIKRKVKEFIIDSIMMGNSAVALRDDASFLDHGVLDSTGVLELVSFLEQAFRIKVRDEEMIPENLDSLHNVERFVHGKLPAMA